jgi:hypothetical protein
MENQCSDLELAPRDSAITLFTAVRLRSERVQKALFHRINLFTLIRCRSPLITIYLWVNRG